MAKFTLCNIKYLINVKGWEGVEAKLQKGPNALIPNTQIIFIRHKSVDAQKPGRLPTPNTGHFRNGMFVA